MNSDNSEDRLSILLYDSLSRVRRESKSKIYLLYLIPVLACVVLMSVSLDRSDTPILALPVLIFLAYQAWAKTCFYGRILKFYDDSAVPELVLDRKGLTCPIVLMDYISKAPEYSMRSGQATVRIKWNDIEKWKIVPRSQRIFSSLYLIDMKKGAMVPELSNIMIKRDFSEEQEKQLLGFAQKFLSIPIGPLPTARHEAAKISWKTVFLAVALFTVFLAIKLFKA